MSFLGEIKRRKIIQVAAVYAVVAWLLIQIVATIVPLVHLPDWTATLVIVLLAIGFPITLIMSWGYNLTPEGLVREGGDSTPARKGRRPIEYVFVGLLALAVAFLLLDNYVLEGDDTALQPAAVSTATLELDATQGVLPNSIAVLAFENLSPDPDNAYFAAGIHESTLNQLAKIRDLIVIARTSVLQYENNPLPIPDIAKALNVGYVMEGSVRYANGRVLIAAQLIDGQTGGHLWSDEYDRELTDVFAVQAEVAGHIATAMQVELLPDERARIEKRPTESTEAYQYYLRAMSISTGGSLRLRRVEIESLEKAIAADPEFAEAHAELAGAYFFARDRELSLEHVRRALELDPNLGSAHSRLAAIHGLYFDRLKEADAAGRRAIELSPNDPAILTAYARDIVEQPDRLDEAIQLLNRAVAIDPNLEGARLEAAQNILGYAQLRAGNFAAASQHLRAASTLRPDAPGNYWMLANMNYLQGDKETAKENLDYAVQITAPDYTLRLGYMAYLYGLLGDLDQATALTDRLKRTIADPERENWRYLRWATLGTRDSEFALQEWTRVVDGYIEQGERVSPGTIGRFRDNWLNDPMLEEPEFLELRRRLGYGG